MDTETKKNDSDEISLIDLVAVLWQRKRMIIGITLAAAIGIVIFSIISIVLPAEISPLPNVYTPEALILIDEQSSGGGGGLSSMLGGNTGGLADLMGINMRSGSTLSALALFLVETNSFLDAVVDEFDLIERYEIRRDRSPRAESRKELKKNLEADFDEDSGVLTLGFSDIDPVFARDVVNFSVELLSDRFDELGLDKNKVERENININLTSTFDDILRLEEELRRLEQSAAFGRIPAITMDLNRISMELEAKKEVYTQLIIQSELLRVDMASERTIFQILEIAEVPDQKSGPSRGLISIIVTFAAGFFSVFLALARNAVDNIKKDTQSMAKLRGVYEK